MLLNLFFRSTHPPRLWISGATVFVFGGLLVLFDTWRIVRSGGLRRG